MGHHVPLLLALCAPLVAACFQELDNRAASGSGGSATMAADVTEGQAPPVDLMTPPIDLGDGATTSDPCVATTQRALQIRQKYCAACHSPPAKMGGFDFVLDDGKLKTGVSSTALDDGGKPQRFITPGAPEQSRLYELAVEGTMPPQVAPPLPPNPAPTVSDLSILRTWISSCLGAKPAAPIDAGAAGDAGSDG